MDIKIELQLRGYLFVAETITIPEHDDRMKWPEQIEYRESLIRAAVIKLKSLYHPQIDKCRGIYQIYVRVPSKVEFVPDEEI